MAITQNFLDLLKSAQNIAVVGLSDKPNRPSYQVSSYMKRNGYRIIPVNPEVQSVFGQKSYKSLLEIPEDIRIDIVNIFRRSEEVLPIVEDAIKRGTGCIWMQLGVISEKGREKAESAGIPIVMDSCIAVAHGQLERSR